MRWNRETFLKELRGNATREVAQIGETLCEFTESQADTASWGRGKEHGTLTFKVRSDFGMISLFQISTRGLIKFPINSIKQKGIPRPVLQDYRLKLESNFLKDYDEENHPSDSFEDMSGLFNTSAQVSKFTQCIEGIAYRLRQ
ncbi:MAG: hypothetical protein V3U24_01895 [Candidatus Neomarinimicrobiota bacterium]